MFGKGCVTFGRKHSKTATRGYPQGAISENKSETNDSKLVGNKVREKKLQHKMKQSISSQSKGF